MEFAVIAATDKNFGIGKAGLIPWRFPEDFKWFKKTTAGSTCFMGKHTYLELAQIMQGKPELLPGRRSVVITSSYIADPRVISLSNINEYRRQATEKNFFIGGNGIFKFGLGVADTVYLTEIPGDFDCDVRFPSEDLSAHFVLNRYIPLSSELQVGVYTRIE